MGATDKYFTLDGGLTEDQVRQEWETKYESERVEYGTDPYSGSLATCDYFSVFNKSFENQSEALDWCYENVDKRTAAAIKYRKKEQESTAKPTFGGNEAGCNSWGRYSSYNLEGSPKKFIPADQLTDNQKESFAKLWNQYQEKVENKNEIESVFNELVDQLKVTSPQSPHRGEFTSYRELKSARKAYQRAYNSYEKIKEKFEETNERYKKKLYKTKEKDYGYVWLIYALCAE